MYTWAKEYYKNLLSNSGKFYYEKILKNVIQHNTNVYFKNRISLKPINKELTSVIEAIRKDHPEIFWVNFLEMKLSMSILYSAVHLESFYSELECNRMIEMCEKWRNWVINCIPKGFDEKEKIWLLFDYLARQMKYGNISDQHSQTIVSAFSEGEHISVCEGISKSFKYLCDSLGIPCIIVFGEAKSFHDIGHAWNIVECNNEMWHIDVTREINNAHIAGKANNKRFLFKDFEMDEYIWDRYEVPKCS